MKKVMGNIMIDYIYSGKGDISLIFVHGAFIDKLYWQAQVDYFHTKEELLMKYAHSGYEVTQLHGTCHYPMIELPVAFNQLLQDVIPKIK
jgi:hypothetical protein